MVTILFSDRGTPATYRHMHGFGSRTFMLVNAAGAACRVKYHFKTEAGIRNLTAADAMRLAGSDPGHATRDLFAHLKGGQAGAWRAYVQIMPLAAAYSYRYDPFDVTKVWRHQDHPLVPIGRLVLDRNPEISFADIEQAAFSLANLVPGVEPSPDKLLQGRLFTYPDAIRYRLGANFAQIPVNRPAIPVANYQRDGAMRVDGNGGAAVNYEPNGYHGPTAVPSACEAPIPLSGAAARTPYAQTGRADDFEQAGMLWRVLGEDEKARLVANIAGHLGGAAREIQERQLQHFLKADAAYGGRVAHALGIPPVTAR